MTNFGLVMLSVLVAACGNSMARDTLPHTYTCDGQAVVISGDAAVGDDTAPLVTSAGDVDRYAGEHATYLVPHDRLADAMLETEGRHTRCIAQAGYTDVLVRYMKSESVHEVATQLRIDDDTVRGRILTGWARLGTRYRRER